ncbi:MAG: subtilisin family serine protease [Mariniblastus sp.]|jgi:subtilisin family serine protease
MRSENEPMSFKPTEASEQRRLRFEQFEQRLVMSAQAVASVLPELDVAAPAITQLDISTDQSATTQASDIAAQYGLDGSGQTVAVIDSGIAWDHYALGGGYGQGNKVVGGWDFAENDANPYDDGPAGYHGSHVAGIIGSTDDQYQGVSSGVDLVGLRVFTDSGEGNLDWVEQALQWVHDHKDDFANPITTVNLSLGTSWNADSMPEWASLEDEFAQLEADGLFISVAAGNSFLTFGEAGLSYPAVSEFVVPVASHDANGNISDFSQRDDSVLVAPGESIRSTVPDHLFGGTENNRFLGSTGTSMAAPYVAGASAVLRQANEFMGVTDVNQDMLYQQFRNSADQIYDTVTGGYYYKINLDAALASVIHDRHGDTGETSTNAGILTGGESIEGVIGKISDVDSFHFTAQHSGQITLNFEVTDNLVPLVEVNGANATITGHEVIFDVVAGQEYNFAVATADGTGHYKINVISNSGAGIGSNGPTEAGSETASGVIDWGVIVSKQFSGQQINGSQTFELTTVRNGLLTIEGGVPAGDSLRVEVYDSQMRLVGTTQSNNGELRLDVNATKGEKFFVKAIGNTDDASFRASNLISLTSGNLFVHGTDKSDSISVDASHGFDIEVNGVHFQFAQSEIQHITVIGHAGNDSIELQLGSENDRVNTRTNGFSAANSKFSFNAFSFETASVDGGGGNDLVSMIGSARNDSVVSGMENGKYTTRLTTGQTTASATGFELVHIVQTQGSNAASFTGTQGNDLFVSRGERSWLKMDIGTTLIVDGYDSIHVKGGGGTDYANLFDSAGNDRFVLSPRAASLTTGSYEIVIGNISRINAFSTSGHDSVTFNDSSGDDIFNHRAGLSILNGNRFTSLASGFADVHVNSTGGNDFAQIYDTSGNDLFYSDAGDTEMVATNLNVATKGFKQVNLIANHGGQDRAFLNGTHQADVVIADGNTTRMKMSNGQTTRVVGMDETTLDLRQGLDLAFLTGTEGNDRLDASYSQVELETTLQLLRMTNVTHTHFDGNGGIDEVNLHEVGELDLIESLGDQAVAFLNDHTVNVNNFDSLAAETVDGALAEYDLERVDFQYLLRGNWQRK